MSGPVLYSTNVFLKFIIQEKYRNDLHYAWCSESFDSSKASAYSSKALVPPSSNPADIYRELHQAVTKGDWHCQKIKEQKALFSTRAVEWEAKGEISPSQRDEILYIVEHAPFSHWRPLLYVIPWDLVASRAELVPVDKRAGFGNEYIVKDLKRTEFDVIEFQHA